MTAKAPAFFCTSIQECVRKLIPKILAASRNATVSTCGYVDMSRDVWLRVWRRRHGASWRAWNAKLPGSWRRMLLVHFPKGLRWLDISTGATHLFRASRSARPRGRKRRQCCTARGPEGLRSSEPVPTPVAGMAAQDAQNCIKTGSLDLRPSGPRAVQHWRRLRPRGPWAAIPATGVGLAIVLYVAWRIPRLLRVVIRVLQMMKMRS
jgi:hypothetical protein